MRATARPQLFRRLGDDPDHCVAHLGLPLRRAFLAGVPAVLGDAQRQMRRPRGRQLGVTVVTRRPFGSGREAGRGDITWKGPSPVKGLK
ncbi:hypothetical protein [Streptomyces sp. yara]|uniref:hypothetical protein n=1 Tax=Streptomyces sp. yara TaxID=3458421 RepID=UPI004040269F